MKKILLLLFTGVALVASLTGCRTAEGAGEDIEEAGEEIQEEVD